MDSKKSSLIQTEAFTDLKVVHGFDKKYVLGFYEITNLKTTLLSTQINKSRGHKMYVHGFKIYSRIKVESLSRIQKMFTSSNKC